MSQRNAIFGRDYFLQPLPEEEREKITKRKDVTVSKDDLEVLRSLGLLKESDNNLTR